MNCYLNLLLSTTPLFAELVLAIVSVPVAVLPRLLTLSDVNDGSDFKFVICTVLQKSKKS